MKIEYKMKKKENKSLIVIDRKTPQNLYNLVIDIISNHKTQNIIF